MPNKAKNAFTSRWVAGACALGALTAATASAVGLASPAAADSASYLQSLQPKYTSLSEAQLLSAGHRACASARSGVPASDNVILVSEEFGVSVPVAYEIVLAGINHLGC